tara:strand:+ start:5646 stop:6614 length:969 start_codon:yes stop_codon:yes gene_type:complete
VQHPCIAAAVAAVCAALSGPAAAQSSVVVFGKIDSGYVNKIGTKAAKGENGLGEGAQSRVGFRGTEELGGGLKAFFWLEHRFRSDTGQTTAARFWQGQSILGLQGPWGSVSLGRDYIAGYVEVQMAPDPFIHTGVSSMVSFGNGNIGTVRNDGAVTYKIDRAGFGLQAQVANARNPNSATLPAADTAKHPTGLSASYRSGPVFVGYSYENPGGEHDHWHFAAAQATVGPVTLAGGYGQGRTNTLERRRSWIVGAFMPVGSGRLKAVYGDLRNTSGDATISRKYAVGYNHNLTRRSFLYANFARDTQATADRNGVDIGMQHNF